MLKPEQKFRSETLLSWQPRTPDFCNHGIFFFFCIIISSLPVQQVCAVWPFQRKDSNPQRKRWGNFMRGCSWSTINSLIKVLFFILTNTSYACTRNNIRKHCRFHNSSLKSRTLFVPWSSSYNESNGDGRWSHTVVLWKMLLIHSLW